VPAVTGEAVGAFVGEAVEGELASVEEAVEVEESEAFVGEAVGEAVEGALASVGEAVELEKPDAFVGEAVGAVVGEAVELEESEAFVGESVELEESEAGEAVGAFVGEAVGAVVGEAVELEELAVELEVVDTMLKLTLSLPLEVLSLLLLSASAVLGALMTASNTNANRSCIGMALDTCKH